MTVTTAIWASACQVACIGAACELADASAVRSRLVARTCSERRLRSSSPAAGVLASSSAAVLADARTSTVTLRDSGGQGAVLIAGAAFVGDASTGAGAGGEGAS